LVKKQFHSILLENINLYFSEKNISIINNGKEDLRDKNVIPFSSFFKSRRMSSSGVPSTITGFGNNFFFYIPETLWTYSLIANLPKIMSETRISLAPAYYKSFNWEEYNKTEKRDFPLYYYNPKIDSALEAANEIKERKVDAVYSYVDNIAYICFSLLKKGYSEKLAERLVITGNYCYDFYLDLFSLFFDKIYDSCKTYDGGLFFKRFLSRENGWDRRYTVNDCFCHIEEESDGRVIVSDLLNYCAPFIGYTNDNFFIRNFSGEIVSITREPNEWISMAEKVGKIIVDNRLSNINFKISKKKKKVYYCSYSSKLDSFCRSIGFELCVLGKGIRPLGLKHSFFMRESQ